MDDTYKMNPEIMKLLNEQISVELQNERVYRQFAFLLDVYNWPGTMKWMVKASDEERGHAQKFADWVITNFGTPTLPSLDAVMTADMTTDGEDLRMFWKGALKLEHENTIRINHLYKAAFEAGEWATCNFLGFLLNDQIEAEREISDYITSLERMDKGQQVLWDAELE